MLPCVAPVKHRGLQTRVAGEASAADHPRQQPDEGGGGGGDFEEQDDYGAVQEAPAAARQLGSDGHLREQLRRLDGKSYKAYNDIKGARQRRGGGASRRASDW